MSAFHIISIYIALYYALLKTPLHINKLYNMNEGKELLEFEWKKYTLCENNYLKKDAQHYAMLKYTKAKCKLNMRSTEIIMQC